MIPTINQRSGRPKPSGLGHQQNLLSLTRDGRGGTKNKSPNTLIDAPLIASRRRSP